MKHFIPLIAPLSAALALCAYMIASPVKAGAKDSNATCCYATCTPLGLGTCHACRTCSSCKNCGKCGGKCSVCAAPQ